MTDVVAESVAKNLHDALRLLEAAIIDCPDELCATDLWPDEAPTAPARHGGLEGSAPWFLAYHALTVVDYDLSAELEASAPPPPVDDNTWSLPNRMFTKPELLGYVEHCRARARRTLGALTMDDAVRVVPGTHRHSGMRYGVLVGSLPVHVVEHASQVRQFVTAAGVEVRPMPGDRGCDASSRR